MKKKIFCIAVFCSCMLMTGCPSQGSQLVDVSRILSEMKIDEGDFDSEGDENIPTTTANSNTDSSAVATSPITRTDNSSTAGTSVSDIPIPSATSPAQTFTVPAATSTVPKTATTTSPQTRPADSYEFTAPEDTGANDSDFDFEDFGIGTPSTVGKDNGVNTVPFDENVEIEDWFLI